MIITDNCLSMLGLWGAVESSQGVDKVAWWLYSESRCRFIYYETINMTDKTMNDNIKQISTLPSFIIQNCHHSWIMIISFKEVINIIYIFECMKKKKRYVTSFNVKKNNVT